MSPKVLVVDDEDLLLWSVAEKLGEGGFEVVTAPDGKSAQTLIDHGAADLAIFDLRLPDTSGLELARSFRAKKPGAPFIVMTAYEKRGSREEAEKLGAVAYFNKPFDFDELLEAVRAALSRL